MGGVTAIPGSDTTTQWALGVVDGHGAAPTCWVVVRGVVTADAKRTSELLDSTSGHAGANVPGRMLPFFRSMSQCVLAFLTAPVDACPRGARELGASGFGGSGASRSPQSVIHAQ